MYLPFSTRFVPRLTTLVSILIALFWIGLIALCLIAPLSPARAADTIVNLGSLWDGLVPYFIAGLSTLITAILGWAAVRFQQWTGMKLDENARNVLQTAANNGANLVLGELGARAHATNIDVKHASIATGIRWMETSAADSIKRLNVSPEKIAGLVRSKLTEKIADASATAAAAAPAVEISHGPVTSAGPQAALGAAPRMPPARQFP